MHTIQTSRPQNQVAIDSQMTSDGVIIEYVTQIIYTMQSIEQRLNTIIIAVNRASVPLETSNIASHIRQIQTAVDSIDRARRAEPHEYERLFAREDIADRWYALIGKVDDLTLWDEIKRGSGDTVYRQLSDAATSLKIISQCARGLLEHIESAELDIFDYLDDRKPSVTFKDDKKSTALVLYNGEDSNPLAEKPDPDQDGGGAGAGVDVDIDNMGTDIDIDYADLGANYEDYMYQNDEA